METSSSHTKQRSAGKWPSPAFLTSAFLVIAMLAIVIVLLALPKPWDLQKIDSVMDYVRTYAWWAAVINLIPLGLLALTAKFWTRTPPSPPSASPPNRWPRGFRRVVLGAMLVSAIPGAMRLDYSLWGDEMYATRRAIIGSYRPKDEGTMKFKELPWNNTFWSYAKPTNHIFQSILSRLSLSVWRVVARPKGLQFNETAIRLPVYLAGILSVAVLALLLAEVDFFWAGAMAAWLLALHPWHLRLISEARGYGIVMLLVPLACLLALRALRNGQWRYWIALGATEFALLYTWPIAIVMVIILNLCILARLLTGKEFSNARAVPVMRWLVSQIVAGMVFLQLFLPCLPQVMADFHGMFGFFSHTYWLKNTGTLLLTGSLWSKSGLQNTPYMEYMPQATSHPWLFPVAIGCIGIFLLLGIVRLGLSGPKARWLVPVFILPGPLMYVWAVYRDYYLYEWYMAFLLPGLAGLVALGALWLVRPLTSIPRWRWAVAAYAVLIVGGFAALSNPARSFMLTRPAQATKESVLLTRSVFDPKSADPTITATTARLIDLYDPRVRGANTLEKFAAMMQEADEQNVPFFVNNGYEGAVKLRYPDIGTMLEDPAVFERIGHLTGYEEMLDREVYRYRPGGIQQADFERYKLAVPKKGDPSIDIYY